MNQENIAVWLKGSLGLLGGLGIVGGSWLGSPSLAETSEPVQLEAPRILNTAETLSPSGKNSYVDNNNYSPPSQVILSDRTTNCQTINENGRLTGGSCGVVPKPRYSQAPARRLIASRRLVPWQAAKSYEKPVPTLRRQSLTANRLQINGVSLALAPLRGVKSLEKLAPAPQYLRATRMSPTVSPQRNRTDLLFPLALPAAISSAFGWRTHPITARQTMHSGTDLAAPLGTPVLAAYPGQVAQADWVGGYGLMITLRHLEGRQESRYAHLSEVYVTPGEWVEQGAVIGRVGNTGFSTGPHLHFEWRHFTEDGWVAVDAGVHLEYALENLLQSMQLAEKPANTGS